MPDRDPNHLYPAFRDRIITAISDLNRYLGKHHPGYSAKLIEGFRSTERQQQLYAQGRTKPGKIVTKKNGTTNKSNHQSSLAADVGIFLTVPLSSFGGVLNTKTTYVPEPPKDVMDYYGHCLRKQGLEWGGDWKGDFKDTPHAEWPNADKLTYQKARAWQKEQGLR